jgi:hypothetical protein
MSSMSRSAMALSPGSAKEPRPDAAKTETPAGGGRRWGLGNMRIRAGESRDLGTRFTGGAPHPSVSGISGAVGIEECSSFEHRAGDRDEAVGDGAEGSGVVVTSGSEGCISGAADRVALSGDAGPVVDGVAQPDVRGLAHHHDPALARAPRDGCDAGQAAQGLVVSALQGFPCLCEQRGEDDPSDSGQGFEDRHVALLTGLSRLGFALAGESGGEPVELLLGLADLAVDQGEPLGDGLEVVRRRAHRPRGHRQGRLPEPVQHLGGIKAADPVALEQSIHRRRADPGGFRRGRHKMPEFQEPGRRDVVGEFQHLR